MKKILTKSAIQILGRKLLIGIAAAALVLGVSAGADATFIGTFEGNDCSGVFGTGFMNCVYKGSPVIIKFEFDDDGKVKNSEVNSTYFPTITGNEFSFNFSGGGVGDNGDTGDGSWTYTPGPGDPRIVYYVAKGGPSFNLFSNDGDPNSDIWFTPTNPTNSKLYGLSHLTFYDSGVTSVPEPATMLLLGLGLLGVAGVRRKL